MRANRVIRHLGVAVLSLFLAAGCGGRRGVDPHGASDAATLPVLSILMEEGLPAYLLEVLATEYEASVEVDVQIITLPTSVYEKHLPGAYREGSTPFAISIGRADWLAEFAEKGQYLDLSSFLKNRAGIADIHHRIRRTMSEYPVGSGRYYAVPFYPDPHVYIYRKDLWSREDVKTTFRETYDRDPSPPTSWSEIRDLALFSQHSAHLPGGLGLITERERNGLGETFLMLLAGSDGLAVDEDALLASGNLDGEQGIESVHVLRELMMSSPDTLAMATQEDIVLAFVDGKINACVLPLSALRGIRIALPDADIAISSLPSPGPPGAVPMKGYGMSISAVLPDEQRAMAEAFIEWFLSEEVQAGWVASGGQALRTETIRSLREQSGDGAVYADGVESMSFAAPFPMRSEMLPVLSQRVADALDRLTPTEVALGAVAIEWDLSMEQDRLLKD